MWDNYPTPTLGRKLSVTIIGWDESSKRSWVTGLELSSHLCRVHERSVGGFQEIIISNWVWMIQQRENFEPEESEILLVPEGCCHMTEHMLWGLGWMELLKKQMFLKSLLNSPAKWLQKSQKRLRERVKGKAPSSSMWKRWLASQHRIPSKNFETREGTLSLVPFRY